MWGSEMKCPYCQSPLGGNPYGEGRLCSRCGYVEVLDDKAPVPVEVAAGAPDGSPAVQEAIDNAMGIESVLDPDPPDDGPPLEPAKFKEPVRHTPRQAKKGKKK